MLIELMVDCFFAAADEYHLPWDQLYGIYRVEGGWVGLAKPNKNKAGRVVSEDLGPFQVNTVWLKTFTNYWELSSTEDTYVRLRDNGCANAYAAAAILRYHLQQTGDMDKAVARYHTGPAGSAEAAARYLNAHKHVLQTGRLPPRAK